MTAVDPITLEVLRNRLEAIGEEAAAALERTAISPVVTESKDYSCTLLDGAGRLVIGAGQIQFHFRAASHAVQSTMARFGDEIDDGDVFVANDPHHGGGLHPQDVMVQRPVFVDGHRVAWVVMSAHMMDVGGMVAGSFAPAATECYQEALRLPPVRLFRKGREETGIWDVFRNNIRLPALVEMDMRSLVAGCHVAQDNIAGVVASMGVDTFVESIETTRRLSEAEMRRRIGLLADGRYRATSWTEWDDEFFKVPCELTVAGDRLVFDFSGASPQTNHFFNSKPYIIESEMVAQLAWLLARDLPYDDGIFAPIELRCPEGTIVNSVEPAPIAAAHMDVALNASEVGVQCVRLALGASPDHPARRYLSGWGPGSALGLHTWSCAGIDGRADAFIMLDGNWVGSSASGERDGLPLAGSILGMRRWLPLEGAGGGLPGNRTEFLVHRADGVTEAVPTHASGIVIGEGDTFQFRCASGGGFGDPLDRDPELVMRDIELFALSPAEAEAVYGVLVGADGHADPEATAVARAAARLTRLARAQPPARPVDPQVNIDGPEVPLYPGIVQRGDVALAEASGRPLATAPDHWTDGCPVLIERIADHGPEVVMRSYLDPGSGDLLYAEVTPAGEERAFEVSPERWTTAGRDR